jgi:hypothetical protein
LSDGIHAPGNRHVQAAGARGDAEHKYSPPVLVFSVSSPAMNFFSIRPIVLDLVFILLCSSVVQSKRCSNPSVHREWNSLSETERAEWITAVKVCVLYYSNSCFDSPLTKRYSQCINTLPHNDSLFASVDPALSLIPPINKTSTYYDGNPIPVYGNFNSRFRRLRLYSNGS